MFYYEGTADEQVPQKQAVIRCGERQIFGENDNEKGVSRGRNERKRAMQVGKSYRDELRVREVQRVREEFYGGGYGCPGEYFCGAAVQENCKIERKQCEECWSRTYAGEEWIPYEKREE